MFLNLINRWRYKTTTNFPKNFKMLVTNNFEKRHFETNEGKYVQLFYEQCNSYPDGCVYDVGAHMGIFSITAALNEKMIKKVFAFEPTPYNFKTLRRNIRANDLDGKINAINIALGDVNGESFIQGIPKSGWGGSSILREPRNGEKRIKVVVKRGDDFIAENKAKKPTLIKIDVEGYEFEVLKGFTATLKECRPALFIEFHLTYLEKKGSSEDEIHSFLVNLGYTRIFREKWINGNQYQTIYIAKKDEK
jgi:FkbM family methyltransferase